MRKNVLLSITLLALLAVTVAVLAVSQVQQQGDTKSPNANRTKQKNLREIAMERDVEVEGPSGCDLADMTMTDLSASSNAIVYGRIIPNPFSMSPVHPSSSERS